MISAFKAPTSRQGPLCYRMQPPCRQGWGLPFLLPGRQSGRCDVSTGAVSVGHETGQAPCLDEKCMNAIDCNAPGVRGGGRNAWCQPARSAGPVGKSPEGRGTPAEGERVEEERRHSDLSAVRPIHCAAPSRLWIPGSESGTPSRTGPNSGALAPAFPWAVCDSDLAFSWVERGRGT